MWKLVVSIVQIAIGLAAIASYIIIAIAGESMEKWTVTLILAIAFVVLGINGLVNWAKMRRRS